MENRKNQINIGIAIVVAGVIIAGAILLRGKTPTNPSPTPTNQGSPNANTPSATIKPVSASDYTQGNPNADVVMIEYADYQCPFCGRFFKQTIEPIEQNYVNTGKIEFVYRDFAFLGAESQEASEAAACANDQGKYWQYHDYLFNHQNGENEGAFASANLETFAKTLGLNTSEFNSCLESGKYAQAVQNSTTEGSSIGVTGTPHSFILKDGKVVNEVDGAYPYSQVSQELDAALKQ
jgi:protein-disulfide isomerase